MPLQALAQGVPFLRIEAAPDAKPLISYDRIGQALSANGTRRADVPGFPGSVVVGREECLGIPAYAQRSGSPSARRIRPGVLQKLRLQQLSSVPKDRFVRHAKLPC